MRMPNKREWAALALLPAVIYVAVASDWEDSGVVSPPAPAARARTASGPAGGLPELDLTLLRREPAASEPANAFESKSWYVPPPPPPPPPPAVVLPPPPPTAPPLPFTFLGLYQDAAKPVLFLVRGDRVLTVSAGEVIEGTYRVDGIVGSTLGITYLPLNIKQTLSIGNAG